MGAKVFDNFPAASVGAGAGAYGVNTALCTTTMLGMTSLFQGNVTLL